MWGRGRAIVAVLCTAVFVAACGDDDVFGPGNGEARVRFVSGVLTANALEFALDDGPAEILGFEDVTEYRRAASGRDTFRVSDAGGSLFDGPVDLVRGRDQTIFAFGPPTDISAVLLDDDPVEPAAGTALVRAVHGARFVGSVDVYVTGPDDFLDFADPTVPNVRYTDIVPYFQVPSGAWRIRATAAGTSSIVFDSGAISLPSGAIRTLLAIDDPSPTSNDQLDLIALAD
jgi:hypothetical protein